MARLSNLATIAFLLGVVSCASVDSSGSAREEILRLDASWSQAAATGLDVDRVVSFWSEDAVVFPPGSPAVVGRQAIREYVVKSYQIPGFTISWKTTDVVVADSGDVAYATGTNRVTFRGPDGNPVVVDGRAVTVWRREKAGSWKCVVDIWNGSSSSLP